MLDRRQRPRHTTSKEKQLLTLHGPRGYVCARAEDESAQGLGIRVREWEGLDIGQMVMVHRMHEDQLRMGTIRNLGPTSESGRRVGIELIPEPRLSDISRM